MNQKSLIEYLRSLIDSLYNSCLSLGYNLDEITPFIYQYILDDNSDFSEFDKDYFNCDEYKTLDRKDCLKKFMYSTYFMMKFYYNEEDELYDNLLLDDSDNKQLSNTLDELFLTEEFGIEIVESFLHYLEITEVKRKEMAIKLIKNKDFIDLFGDNPYIVSLLEDDINLEIPEEAKLTNAIDHLYDGISYNFSFDDKETCSNFQKIKKTLMLHSLTKDIQLNKKDYTLKHLFSLMLKSLYINIYFMKKTQYLEISDNDIKLFDIIDKNMMSFDELFLKFINDDKFSSYLIANFYFNNIDKDTNDYIEENEILKKNNLDEKIKNYSI